MARNELKANPAVIVSAHYKTFVDGPSGDPRWQDFAVFLGLPAVAGAVCIWQGVELPASAGVGLLTLSGLLSAFLFGALMTVSERALNWADSEPTRGKATSQQASYLEELAANAAYASLVCIAAAIAFLVVGVSDGVVLEISSALGIALGLHMALVLLMVMRRVFLVTQSRLNDARTLGPPLHGPRRRGGQKPGVGAGATGRT
jgi:hypothetical protein